MVKHNSLAILVQPVFMQRMIRAKSRVFKVAVEYIHTKVYISRWIHTYQSEVYLVTCLRKVGSFDSKFFDRELATNLGLILEKIRRYTRLRPFKWKFIKYWWLSLPVVVAVGKIDDFLCRLKWNLVYFSRFKIKLFPFTKPK